MHLLVYFLNVEVDDDWARLRPGATRGSCVSAESQVLGPSSSSLSGPLARELDRRWSRLDSNQCPHGVLAL